MRTIEYARLLVKSHFLSAIKFGVVGVITAAIYFFVMWFASSVLNFGYILAVSMAYFVSTSFHYLVNRYFTFSAHGGRHSGQLARYMVLWIINYTITIIVVNVSVEHLGLAAYLGVCAAVMITVFVGYFLSRYWIFKIKGVDT
jgi:putative flippase GtrA